MRQNNIYVIILASGDGRRFNEQLPKQFANLKGKTVLEHSIETFTQIDEVQEIIVVTNPLFHVFTDTVIKNIQTNKKIRVVEGGETRNTSSFKGISAISDEDAFVLIHDAARPIVSKKTVIECIYKLQSVEAVAVAVPVSDTIYKINDKSEIEEVPERKYYLQAQTPQGFKLDLIKKAHELARKDENTYFSDDCSMILKYKLSKVYWVSGDEKNIKITYPIDKQIAKVLIKHKE
jgi:2-C-methyl-D-erythritol 4-phosphate cytidylyltransferase